MLKLALSDWICWTAGNQTNLIMSHTHTHPSRTQSSGHTLMDGSRGHSSASVSSRLSITVFRFASDKLLDMRKYHYGGSAWGGLRCGWSAGGKTPLRDNKKSRMGLLGVADIDGYR